MECLAPGDDICGLSVSPREKDDLIQIWNKDKQVEPESHVLEKVHQLVPDVRFNAEFYKRKHDNDPKITFSYKENFLFAAHETHSAFGKKNWKPWNPFNHTFWQNSKHNGVHSYREKEENTNEEKWWNDSKHTRLENILENHIILFFIINNSKFEIQLVKFCLDTFRLTGFFNHSFCRRLRLRPRCELCVPACPSLP